MKEDVSGRERESYSDCCGGNCGPKENGEFWNNPITRRRFLKRTGGATAATMLALHGMKVEVVALGSTSVWPGDCETICEVLISDFNAKISREVDENNTDLEVVTFHVTFTVRNFCNCIDESGITFPSAPGGMIFGLPMRTCTVTPPPINDKTLIWDAYAGTTVGCDEIPNFDDHRGVGWFDIIDLDKCNEVVSRDFTDSFNVPAGLPVAVRFNHRAKLIGCVCNNDD